MKFQRKPSIIEAIQYDGDNEQEIYDAFGSEHFTLLGDSDGFMLVFTTANGDEVMARPGVWVTPDIDPGTFYPIKDDYMVLNFIKLEEPVHG